MGMFTVLPTAEKVVTADDAVRVLQQLGNVEELAADTETDGIDRIRNRAIILALSDGYRRWAIWPEALPYFAKVLEDPKVDLVFHNANFDAWMLANAGIDIYRYTHRTHYRCYDTMVMAALHNDTTGNDLKSTAKDLLDIDMISFANTFNVHGHNHDLAAIYADPAQADKTANYASLDAFATMKLKHKFKRLLTEQTIDHSIAGYRNLWEYYKESEFPYTKVLLSMERAGIRVDQDRLLDKAPGLEDEMLSIQKWFGRKTGSLYVNLNSSEQLNRLFIHDLGRKALSLTKGGAPQIDVKALEAWERQGCEYSKKLLRYRDLSKTLGTYVVNLVERIHTDGRIHASVNQTGARTGRLSYSDPNLQNQPSLMRDAYLASTGHKLMARDYNQLEMRVLAHLTKDPNLCRAIKDGLDVHSSTAALMFGVPYLSIVAAIARKDEIEELEKHKLPFVKLTPEEKDLVNKRKAAKTIQFGLVYGQGYKKLAATLFISDDEAKNLIKKYFATYPSIKSYFAHAIADANETGYCSTICGRRRQVPGLWSIDTSDIAGAERKIKNSPIQGTAAEIAKAAMIKFYEDKYITASGTKLLLQVHDELVNDVPEEFEHDPEFNERVSHIMSHPFPEDLAVPLETTGKYADTWLGTK